MALWSDLQIGQLTPKNRRGKGQGYFRYYKQAGGFDSFVAVNGKLLRNGGDFPITGLPNGFQKDRPIEAVQYRDKMYIATGSGLVVYDGMTASLVTPHAPDPMEALYVGLNALAPDPTNYITDGQGAFLQVNGVTQTKRKGVVNQKTTFTAYCTIPSGMTVEYFWQYKKSDADTFLPTTETWSQTAKSYDFVPQEAVEYDIKVSVRDKNNTSNVATYIVPNYQVLTYSLPPDEDTSGINTCNRILLHWDRLILYGDTVNPNLIHISHLRSPDYFPINNTLAFETDKQEPITKLVQFRDFIVAFTPSTIQALYGKSPADYQRVRLHTGMGCVAPETAQVFQNMVAFLSKEGVHVLKSFGLAESRINVEKIDTKIANLIPLYPESGDACAISYRNQYHICFPSRKTRFRFYADSGMWTKDESPYFDFCRMYEFEGELVVQSQSTGEVYEFDDTIYQDLDHVFEAVIETKGYDLNAPYNKKKIREAHLLIGAEKHDVELSVEVYGDNALLLSTDASFPSVVNNQVVWNEVNTPNVNIESGSVFGDWEFGVDKFGEVKVQAKKLRLQSGGKYRTSKVKVIQNQAKPFQLLSVAFVYKLKKP